jgi:hypothetical protein
LLDSELVVDALEDIPVPAQASEGPTDAISSPERVGRKLGDWQQFDKIKE